MVGSSRTEVCLKAFLALHCVTMKRINRIRSLKVLGKSPKDLRGLHVKKAYPPEVRVLIKQHIESFPTKETHYSGRSVKYLDEKLSVKTMFELFTVKHPDVNVGYTFYYNFFVENFKLSFGRPQIDCCCVCEQLKLKIKSPHLNNAAKRCAEAELAVHKRKSKKFYNKLKEEVDNKSSDPHVKAICFDFMQNVHIPNVPVQDTFYLRQLTTNIFCIHDIKKNTGNIYLYHEGVAKKGPNEVCSFIQDFLDSVPLQYTELHVYSDNCGGQNKNHALVRFLMFLTESKRFQKVEQFFPIRGHSFLPCDRDFSIIKREIKKHDRFYSIHEITQFIIKSSKSHKFIVKEVCTDEILDFKKWWPMLYKKNCTSEETRKKTVPKDQKKKFMISSMMHMTYDSNTPGFVVARDLIDGMVTNTFELKQKTQPRNLCRPTNKAYPLGKVAIKKNKVEDIKKLLPYIPEEYKDFYQEIMNWPTTCNEHDDKDIEDDD